MAQTKIKKELIDASFGTDWIETIQTSNFTAVAGKGYFVNTTSAEITVTLPAGAVGDEIVIQDYAGTFATNKIILAPNGSEKIQGLTNNFRCVINNSTVRLIYQDATKGWAADNIETNLIALSVDYLVVAGGGAGGGPYYGGGGGAGGFLASYGVSGVDAESLITSTNYSITIGGGGTGGAGDITAGSNGTNSTFNTITSTGGGGGGGGNSVEKDGKDGGSGGGASYGTVGSGTSGQGYSGGGLYGGGGGGAGGAGLTGGTPSPYGGDGGAGLSNGITGSSLFYAGGGGGGSASGGTTSGGSGVGGNGGTRPNDNATAGNVSTGSGGGGGAELGSSTGKSGGSGVVILRYSDIYNIIIPTGSGLITGQLNTAVGTDEKYTTFTGGTGTISFNT